MSKSKGNVVTPMGLLDEHGSDAVRYWAASGRPGTDTAFDVGQMKIGRRLAIKLLNASKFVLGKTEPRGPVTEPIDRGMLHRLATLVAGATRDLEGYDYSAALRETEAFFWWFCDDYVELVKGRAYGMHGEAGAASAQAALRDALDAVHRLFAPFLPFVTEEVWSWWRDGSVHHQSWPKAAEIAALAADGDAATLDAVADVLSLVRKAKSDAKKSMRARVALADVVAPAEIVGRVRTVEDDLIAAGGIDVITYTDGAQIDVRAELAPEIAE